MRHGVSHDWKTGICSLCVLFHQEKMLYVEAVNQEVDREWIL